METRILIINQTTDRIPEFVILLALVIASFALASDAALELNHFAALGGVAVSLGMAIGSFVQEVMQWQS